jgi:L-aspartate semialdehyde sulfurtransferase
MRTIASINQRIAKGTVQVRSIVEFKALVQRVGIEQAAKEVDIVTCGSFEPMESSGAILNLGHTDPPIKIRDCWLDDVPAYAGFGAVDLYLGATREVDSGEPEERGGGHVIADLIAGKSVTLRAVGQETDCYPRANLTTTITKNSINQFYLYNPRNLYQNFIVGVNGGDRPLYTYLGPLQPRLGNAVFSNGGAISPLFNDPNLAVVGIGSRIFLGGAVGYVAWEGTQHFPRQRRLDNGTPMGPAATLALIGDAKEMAPEWVRGCYFKNYGSSLMLGVGVPIPILNQQVAACCAITDEEIVAPVVDFSIPRRVRPTFGLVSYAQLKSGKIKIEGKTVRTAPLVSLHRSMAIADLLKEWILEGRAGQPFLLTEPVAPLPTDRLFIPQDRRSSELLNDE